MGGPEVIAEGSRLAAVKIERYPHDRPTIVVVDDDEEIRRLASLALTRKGYHVLQANGADQAITLLEHLWVSGVARPGRCVVLLDIMMPGTDGLTLCRRIKSEFEVAVIMFTGRAAYSDVQAAIRCRADDYLVKPFTVETLAEKVARHVHHEL